SSDLLAHLPYPPVTPQHIDGSTQRPLSRVEHRLVLRVEGRCNRGIGDVAIDVDSKVDLDNVFLPHAAALSRLRRIVCRDAVHPDACRKGDLPPPLDYLPLCFLADVQVLAPRHDSPPEPFPYLPGNLSCHDLLPLS